MKCRMIRGSNNRGSKVQQAYTKRDNGIFGLRHLARCNPIISGSCLELRGIFTEYSGFSDGMP